MSHVSMLAWLKQHRHLVIFARNC